MEIIIDNKKFNVNPSECRYTDFWNEVNNGKWEQSSFNYMDKYLDENSCVIDIGAWIAPLSLYAATIAKKVYTIEPDPVSFNELIRNIEANPTLKDKIFPHKICISDTNKNVFLWNNNKWGNSGSSVIYSNDITIVTKKVTVNAIILNDFIEQNKIEKCDYLKIDIEGEEINVLPNIANYLILEKPILHLSLHTPFYGKYDFENIIKVLKFAKNIFINGIEKIMVESIRSRQGFYDILCEF